MSNVMLCFSALTGLMVNSLNLPESFSKPLPFLIRPFPKRGELTSFSILSNFANVPNFRSRGSRLVGFLLSFSNISSINPCPVKRLIRCEWYIPPVVEGIITFILYPSILFLEFVPLYGILQFQYSLH